MVKVERSAERVQAWELRLDEPLLVIALLFTAALLQPVIPGLPSWTGPAATIVNVASWSGNDPTCSVTERVRVVTRSAIPVEALEV